MEDGHVWNKVKVSVPQYSGYCSLYNTTILACCINNVPIMPMPQQKPNNENAFARLVSSVISLSILRATPPLPNWAHVKWAYVCIHNTSACISSSCTFPPPSILLILGEKITNHSQCHRKRVCRSPTIDSCLSQKNKPKWNCQSTLSIRQVDDLVDQRICPITWLYKIEPKRKWMLRMAIKIIQKS